VRNIPEHVDRALRRKAARERKSFNAILRDALIREAGAAELSDRLYTDLDTFAGTWVDDPGFDDAIRAQDQVDESLWRWRSPSTRIDTSTSRGVWPTRCADSVRLIGSLSR
jgi:hypothetical protein